MIWHYTTAHRLPIIVESHVILPATAGITRHEKPIVWFSTNPAWEPSAAKGLINKKTGVSRTLSFEEMVTTCGIARIGIEESRAPYTWKELVELAHIPLIMARALEKVSEEDGSKPDEWRGTLEPVHMDDWRTIQIYHKGEWRNACAICGKGVSAREDPIKGFTYTHTACMDKVIAEDIAATKMENLIIEAGNQNHPPGNSKHVPQSPAHRGDPSGLPPVAGKAPPTGSDGGLQDGLRTWLEDLRQGQKGRKGKAKE